MAVGDPIRIIKHEAIPGCGIFEVCFADCRVSQYFYFDDIAGRRLRPEMPDPRTGAGAGQGVCESGAGWRRVGGA